MVDVELEQRGASHRGGGRGGGRRRPDDRGGSGQGDGEPRGSPPSPSSSASAAHHGGDLLRGYDRYAQQRSNVKLRRNQSEGEAMRLAPIGVIFGVIGGWADVRADTASQIEPMKIGADSIVNQTLKCRDSAKAAQPKAKPAVLLGYCFCVVDYVRNESGDSNLKFWTFLEKLDSAKISSPISVCNDWAVKHQNANAPVDSPYSTKLDLSSQQIYGAAQGCQGKIKGLNLGAMQRAGLCACIADSMRTMPRRQVEKLTKTARQGSEAASSLPQDKLEYCSRKWDVE